VISQNIKKITGKFIDEKKCICDHQRDCEFRPGEDACMGLLWGGDDSKILVIGEAPSGEDITNSQKWNATYDFGVVRDFLGKKYGMTPHFTDAVKCGFGSGKNIDKKGKRSFKKRFQNCKEYLKEEIDLIKPEKVFCMGKKSYENVIQNVKYLFEKEMDVYYLTHYSKLTNLQIKIGDKEKIVWNAEIDYQLGKPAKIDLNDLEYYSNIKKIG